MGSKGRPFLDLNELPPEDDEDNENFPCIQPQRAVPSSTNQPPDLLVGSTGCHGIVNNHAFSHASSVSGFQPFIRSQSAHKFDLSEPKFRGSSPARCASSPSQLDLHSNDVKTVEKEEGEWSDAEETADVHPADTLHENLTSNHKDSQYIGARKKDEALVKNPDNIESIDVRQNLFSRSRMREDECSDVALTESDIDTNNKKTSSAPNFDGGKVETPTNSQEDTELASKLREARGVEASHAVKCANKRPKIDHKKEAMLGKKRSRQTMFLNLEDVPTNKSLAPKRQNFPAPLTSRTVKEMRPSLSNVDRSGEKLVQSVMDNKQVDLQSNEGGSYMDSSEPKPESNGDLPLSRTRRLNSSTDLAVEAHGTSVPSQNSLREAHGTSVPSQNSLRQPTESRQHKSSQIASRKPAIVGMDLKSGTKKVPSKKQPAVNNQYQDTSVERLLREVTCEKIWHNAVEAELQCVPGQFESVEEYVGVFEPLLFEECRAQLYSTWEEQTDMRDPHIKVLVKHVERRERGWCDVNLQSDHDIKWTFKEGEVAVLSSSYPRPVRSRRNNNYVIEEGDEAENCGRVAGTVRRHIPIDTRERTGATLHFYVGDCKNDNDNILKRLQPRSVWFLTVLGSLATTQREYIALHAFRRLNTQMQNAILQPSPEHFPKYEEQTPAKPECFTTNFVDHLHRTFNEPQLAAIHWAGTHTAAGTSNGLSKRQDPWPFTLVQGPPGTGKTHTVCGMLNVIHLVQYQHYYTALLKKLAPGSYKQVNESNSESVVAGSIDEVLQSMDQNLFHTLPKLCPKPRMLVCAPSNAATDELLSRVLDRGFIDGEMKVYRPDVARVGVDSQTRAAQAVSVERRTEQLLMKSRDEILGWMHQLRTREKQLSQQMSCLQRELTVAAAAGRAQGSVGVDSDVLIARDQNRDALLQNLAAVVENGDKVLVEMSRLIILEGKFRAGGNFNLEEARASLEASFANEAEIVFTTLSSSGRKLFSRLTHGFDMVVIDEAAQASEVGLLPPLSLGAARCVLVGDPQQLPATVISKAAGTLLYSRSLFERFQQAGCPTMLLSVQYRMHPQIRDFPSRYFYQGRLSDSESIINSPDEPYYKDHLLKPYVFYDITHGRESHRGGSVSYENIHEAQFCLRLFEHLQKVSKSLGMEKVTVGIITPYKLQLKCLQREFKDVLSSEDGKDIYINTVDAFQGQERDVIIMSCVRASGHGVGFVADIRRMNVALTRARRALWVMGNANSLIQSEDWATLVSDAKERNCYMHMDSLPKDFLAPKPLPPSALSNRTSNNRSFRPGVRLRHYDAYVESRSGTPSEDEDKSSGLSIQRNGSYSSLRPPIDGSLDDFDQSSDKSRDAWQNGVQRKQNSGVSGKRDL